MIRDTECFSINSDISSRMRVSGELNSSPASTLTSSVLPTPVGPAKMKEAGRRRGLICTRERRTAMDTSETASSCPMIFSFNRLSRLASRLRSLSLILAAGILLVFTMMWVFALQAKFANTLKTTMKNAFAVSIWQFPKTILMVVASCVPVAVCFVSMSVFPIVFLFCFTFPVYVSVLLYDKTFKKLEDQILERIQAENGETTEEEDEEKIFSDAPIIEED